MKSVYFFLFFLFQLVGYCMWSSHSEVTKVGLLIVATGKYIGFVPQLIISAQEFFLPNCEVTFFVFTDSKVPLELKNTICLPHKKLGWPYDTLMRFAAYYHHKKSFEQMDYLFALDADMLFVVYVNNEILGDLVGTLHPGYVYAKRLPYEDASFSSGYVDRGVYYFAGGFYGGTREQVLELCKNILEKINDDSKNGYIAKWHDESYLNRYFVEHYPTVILSPSYCFPNNSEIIKAGAIKFFEPRLVALTKSANADHLQYRQ